MELIFRNPLFNPAFYKSIKLSLFATRIEPNEFSILKFNSTSKYRSFPLQRETSSSFWLKYQELNWIESIYTKIQQNIKQPANTSWRKTCTLANITKAPGM